MGTKSEGGSNSRQQRLEIHEKIHALQRRLRLELGKTEEYKSTIQQGQLTLEQSKKLNKLLNISIQNTDSLSEQLLKGNKMLKNVGTSAHDAATLAAWLVEPVTVITVPPTTQDAAEFAAWRKTPAAPSPHVVSQENRRSSKSIAETRADLDDLRKKQSDDTIDHTP